MSFTRRAVGHGDVSRVSDPAVFPRNHRSLNSRDGGVGPHGTAGHGVLRENRLEAALKLTRYGVMNYGPDSPPNSAASRLKWVNSLYRPALPEAIGADHRRVRLGPVGGVAKW